MRNNSGHFTLGPRVISYKGFGGFRVRVLTNVLVRIRVRVVFLFSSIRWSGLADLHHSSIAFYVVLNDKAQTFRDFRAAGHPN